MPFSTFPLSSCADKDKKISPEEFAMWLRARSIGGDHAAAFKVGEVVIKYYQISAVFGTQKLDTQGAGYLTRDDMIFIIREFFLSNVSHK